MVLVERDDLRDGAGLAWGGRPCREVGLDAGLVLVEHHRHLVVALRDGLGRGDVGRIDYHRSRLSGDLQSSLDEGVGLRAVAEVVPARDADPYAREPVGIAKGHVILGQIGRASSS